MESVGELLKSEREAQGKTIDDVAKATKMSTLIIGALESDHFSALPAPVYVKGHLRTYARFLGLDEDDVVDKYLRFTQQQESTELDEWDAVELELHEEKQRAGRRWIWVAIAVVAVVAVVLGVRHAGSGSGVDEPEAGAPVAITQPVNETVVSDTMIEWHKLELTARASSKVWLKVWVDGEPVSDFEMQKDDVRQWQADEYFELEVGNGEALTLYLDGEELGQAGPDRTVVRGLRIDENGMSR